MTSGWKGLGKDEIKWEGTLYADKFSGDGSGLTGVGIASETDPVFVALSGAFLTAETDPVFVALSGGFLTSESDPLFASLSGTLGDQYLPVALSGGGGAETDPIFTALSGGLAYLPTTLSGSYFQANSGALLANSMSGAYFIANSGGFFVTAASGSLLPASLSAAISAYETSGAPSVSGTITSHVADTSDPHGATLTQTNITSSGQISGAGIFNTGDHNTSAAAYCVGIITSDAATPPTANLFPQGTIYLQYTA